MTAINQAPYPLLGSAIDATLSFFAGLMRRHKAAQELRNIGENEVSSIARDLGVSQTELRSLVTHDSGFPSLLKRMLSALQIDGGIVQEADPILLRDMQKVCAFCQNTRRCRKELEAGSADEHLHDYCPNSLNLYAASKYRRLPDRNANTHPLI
jgi:hypothetical protein